ncbi:hypothetical protein ACFE04_026828 [Oxalis oulophora]
MEKDLLWNMFCGESVCNGKACNSTFLCANHLFIICFDIVLLFTLLFNVTRSSSSSSSSKSINDGLNVKRLKIATVIINGGIGLLYLYLGISILVEKITKNHNALPFNIRWISTSFHGVALLLVSVFVSIRGKHLSKSMPIIFFLFTGIISCLSISEAIIDRKISTKMVIDVLSFPGATLLLLSSYYGYKHDNNDDEGLYTPLNVDVDVNVISNTPAVDRANPWARAGFFSKMSFWWLNPLMKKGKEKILTDGDIPKLRDVDRAESCYLSFIEQLNKQKQDKPNSQPSILTTIILCHWKDILISGFFALLKVLTSCSGPLLLNAFILVAEGKGRFKYEGFVLALTLFLSKSLESVSQRQWYFRSRLSGLKVRSLLTAALYKKQLKLSNDARLMHSSGQIMNYVTVDAYRIGEFSFWLHQTWTTCLQICISLVILFQAVGMATFAALIVIIISVMSNMPLAKLQHKFQGKLMVAQDKRLKATSEALVNMKVLKLYAWETHFKNVIENLRKTEHKWLAAVQYLKGNNVFIFWSSPILVSMATFGACYFLKVPLSASNVFTFLATARVVQDPITAIPNVIEVIIQAKVAYSRLLNFLEAPELQNSNMRKNYNMENTNVGISVKSADFSWDKSSTNLTLKNINLAVGLGQKVAICGEVGSGKSTLLAAILGEIPNTNGEIKVYGRVAYVSQTAWIQSGTIRENILFGVAMDEQRYQETLQRCALVKDLELLPYGDLTEIGERGVNLSGGQKQRIQLARALYQNADIYLLDDPFSAVDAHTATSLFNDYVMDALAKKVVLLVTHQVDFLPAFDSVLVTSGGEILQAASYNELLSSNREFQNLVNAHKETSSFDKLAKETSKKTRRVSHGESKASYVGNQVKGDQLIKQEEREIGDIGLTPYLQYLNQNKVFLLFSIATLNHLIFIIGKIWQSFYLAANVDNPSVSTLKLIMLYSIIGMVSTFALAFRSLVTVCLGLQASESLFLQLLNSLFRAPMSFYDSTPLGRILSRVSSDLNIVDLDIPFSLLFALCVTINGFSNLVVVAVVTWQVLFVSLPVIYMTIHLQRYYFATAKELMRINGTTKSLIANHLSESMAGAMTIRAFDEEERFFVKNLDLIDINASPFFHSFSANEWLILRLEILSAIVLASSAMCMVLLPPGTFSSGFIGMALTYGLSLNVSVVGSILFQCSISNSIISVERLNQYMYIPSEAPEIIKNNRPLSNWPVVGQVDICNLQVRYRPDTPLVIRGINCTIQGGHKVGIVGRTGSGKSTLISALLRLVEPAGGSIIVDGVNITKIGLHDLRSRFGIIPQDPTLFNGTVRYNLDPLSQHTDQEIWEVLGKCQLREVVQGKEQGLDSIVADDGSNWSMGQRQLFCLGRVLLKKSRILVLDEATASIDNVTDMLLQKTIKTEFADSTVILVAHRIPTVMDCDMILAIADGKVVEYDEPMKLIKREGSLFGQLVKEYWSHHHSAEAFNNDMDDVLLSL